MSQWGDVDVQLKKPSYICVINVEIVTNLSIQAGIPVTEWEELKQ